MNNHKCVYDTENTLKEIILLKSNLMITKKIKQPPNSREIVAHHEAGHAVLYFLFGYKVKSITIDNDDVGSGFVDCTTYLPTGYLPIMSSNDLQELFNYDSGIVKVNLAKDLKRYAMICIAGYVAEYKYLKKRMPYGIICTDNPENDFSQVRNEVEKANRVLSEKKYNYLDINDWDKKTRRELNKPAVWESVLDLANMLLGKKNGIIYTDEIESILSKRITPYLQDIYNNRKF